MRTRRPSAPLGSSRWARVAESARSSLWLWPAVAAVAAFVLAVLLLHVRSSASSGLAKILWPGDSGAASTALQVIAASAVTVTTFTFSLMVVALQLASQQFSPRLLREFARDWIVQAVLAVLVATFVFSMTAVRGFDGQGPVPVVAMAVSFLFGLATVAALLVFIGHIIRTLRVDTMMRTVHAETRRTIEDVYTPDRGRRRRPDHLRDRDGGWLVCARTSGFVRTVDAPTLVRAAVVGEAVLRLEVRPGDQVVTGTPLARAWPAASGPAGGSAPPPVVDGVHAAVHLGYERTAEQDVGYGFRQLVDIAVKALSPGINDPATAAHAIGHLADLVVRLAGAELGPAAHEDERGIARVVLPDRDFAFYLDLVCGQTRRYGRREPTVLTSLLRLLRDAAVAARSDEQRAAIERQVGLILAELPRDLVEDDIGSVESFAERVRLALRGDLVGSYRDRSGETRST